jgi:predicted nucleic acid-binding protein
MRAGVIKAVAVLDASAALSWLFADERDEQALAMARAVGVHGALVPPLFRWEVQNALVFAVRRKRLSLDQATSLLHDLDAVSLIADEAILHAPLSAGFGLAQRFELTAYDVAYVELAVRSSLPIMTRDGALARAAAELDILWHESR